MSLLIRPVTHNATDLIQLSCMRTYLDCIRHIATCVLVTRHSVQVDSVGVQIHTDNIWRGVVKVKVAGVHAHYEWTRSVEDTC